METTKQTSSTSELDKMLANKEKSQTIGEFLDWLQTNKKIVLCTNEPEKINYFSKSFETKVLQLGENSPEGRELMYNNIDKWEHAGGLRMIHHSIETLLAEYFGIDLKKAENEKLQILNNLKELKK